MATNNISVKCNFTSIFAQFNTVDELKTLANAICANVKSAYDARVAELKADTTEVEATVEVTTSAPAKPAKTAKPEAKQTTTTKQSKVAAAKEAAAKFKKQADTPKEKPTPKAKKAGADETLISISDIAAIKKLGLTFEKYNDRCWVLRGNTKPLRKVMTDQFHGVFNSRLTGGEGWIVRTSQAQECADALGLKIKVA